MSGMRPTGTLHLGHYFGTLLNWIELQHKHESFFSIVDWHALTTQYHKTQEIKNNILEIALDWLCVGIDPEIATIYVQSAVPEIAELHLILSMFAPHNWVERDPTLKDLVKVLAVNESEAWEKVSYGLLGYPVLQTADILSVKAELVPVGRDQEAHLEFARDLARRFNHVTGVDFFPEPKPEFTIMPVLKGIDGQKMSKSYYNDIKICDTEADTTKRIKQMVTDRTRISKTDPGHTDLCEVPWPWYQIFSKELTTQVKQECESAAIGCVDCKVRLASHINAYFSPFRAKRAELARNPERVYQLLGHGNSKARAIARKTLADLYEIIGFTNWSKGK
jgi:tryptophanyl-tRNA synthetase